MAKVKIGILSLLTAASAMMCANLTFDAGPIALQPTASDQIVDQRKDCRAIKSNGPHPPADCWLEKTDASLGNTPVPASLEQLHPTKALPRNQKQYSERIPPFHYQDLLDGAMAEAGQAGERFRHFADEPLDLEWSPRMEAGITNYFAHLGPQSDLVLEYRECRSDHCLVLGKFVNIPAVRADGRAIKSLLCREAWWVEVGPCVSIFGKEQHDNQFVILVSRADSGDTQ